MRSLCLPSAFVFAIVIGCTGGDPIDESPTSVRSASGQGPTVVWDPTRQPFSEIPLPNDVATSPDPSSPTGLRVNVSIVAPTSFDRTTRAGFDLLDGWGTYQPATVAFDADIDIGSLLQRMRGDNHRFADDPVYLISLATGIPIPLDVGDGDYAYNLADPNGYWPNDPRAGEPNAIFETVDEDVNHNGILDPGEDTNFDGILNHAAVFPPGSSPQDHLTPFWEPDSHTLILRPLLPLEERTRYAVVLTDRLRGANGPVRSPFPAPTLPAQASVLSALDTIFRDRHPEYYGGLVFHPRDGVTDPPTADHVVFAWTYTTETTVSAMRDLRAGLYGQGPYARTLAPYTPDITPVNIPMGSGCTADQTARPYILRGAALSAFVSALAAQEGPSGAAGDREARWYHYVDYVVAGTYRTPYLMGDPRSTDPYALAILDPSTGSIPTLGEDTVQWFLAVPKALRGAHAPFPVALYGHGYSGQVEDTISNAPDFAAQGVALLGINGPGHGIPFNSAQRATAQTLLNGLCLGGLGGPILHDRARDLDGDGVNDPGGDFWTAYVFHTRDMVRQMALDFMQIVRAFRSFDGRTLAADDYNQDGMINDLAGDFNGDGTVDVGGPDGRYYITGQSLGGIMSMIVGGAEPMVRAAVPVSGGGGLTDIALRSVQGGVREAVFLRMMGPIVESIPASAYTPNHGMTTTSCHPGQNSLRFYLPDVNRVGQLEFACLDVGTTPSAPGNVTIQSGDDVALINRRTGVVRCARAGMDGTFRVAVATDADDPLSLVVFNGSVIRDFGTCTATTSAVIKGTIQTWQVVSGDCGIGCGAVAQTATSGQSPEVWSTRGADLTAPTEGMGLRRQSPELRRYLFLTQAAVDPADPISYAPLFLRQRPSDAAQHAALVINTLGDQAVPVSTGNAFARAMGVLPFLAPDAPVAYRDLATPMSLLSVYTRTPDTMLVDRGVIEGISRFDRFPSASDPGALFDVDNLSEGMQGFGQQTLTLALRLVRMASLAVGTDDAALAVVWTPTLGGRWSGATGPVDALLNADTSEDGKHGYDNPDPSRPWDPGTYLQTVIARFFSTDGQDVYYRSHPMRHECAATATCDFIPPLPP